MNRLGRQDFKVLWSVIVAYLIQMMYDLSMIQRAAYFSFSDHDSAAHVTRGLCSRMSRLIQQHITVCFPMVSTFPPIGIFHRGLMFRGMEADVAVPCPTLLLHWLTAATRTQGWRSCQWWSPSHN